MPKPSTPRRAAPAGTGAPERASSKPLTEKAARPVTMAEAEAAISTFVEKLHALTRTPARSERER